MAPRATSMSNLGPVSAGVDPAFWARDASDSSSVTLHYSPGASSTSTTHPESVQSNNTQPAQTPVYSGNGSQKGLNGNGLNGNALDARGNANRTANGQLNGLKPSPAALTARTSVAVACLPCRLRHLKCDGKEPGPCSRCRTEEVYCKWEKSRRGWKGRKKARTGETGLNGPHSATRNGSILQSPIHSNGHSANTIQQRSPERYLSEYSLESGSLALVPSSLSHVPDTSPVPVTQYNLNGTERNDISSSRDPISAFFFYFYESHPFVLPRQRLLELFKTRRAPLLELAVQYMGSSFLPAVPTAMYEQALERALLNQNYSHDGYSLQALLLFAIGLHANNKVPRAAQIFALAQSMTLELGVNQPEFALVNGNNDRVLEECWRRTWWSMYTANGMMAAVNPGVQFRLKDYSLDVPLPCENDRYFSGQIPYPHTLQEYDDDAFSGGEPTIFSSFTYLIDAIRILGKVFEVAKLDSAYEYHAVDVVDSYLCNWRNNLPPSKLDITSNDGAIDEVLFQAHMVNAGSTIMLHRPRSNLGFGAVENVNICVQPGQILLPTQTREIHTAKCFTSAENISSLIKLPGPLLHHTPFFTCVVVMASVVHLSYWSFLVPDGQDDNIKQSIRLDVGTLQHYGNTWPIAKVVLGQVRGVAHTLWHSKKSMSIHLWNNIVHDEVIRSVICEGEMEPLENYSQLLAPMLKS